ncbi:hypothetical protein RB195_009722 [Necator americanus]|uniref:Uncharacterized protein n=1 Tax=Necator americanus TaxID=51031 RepID=A0ABR1CUL5_NECAM
MRIERDHVYAGNLHSELYICPQGPEHRQFRDIPLMSLPDLYNVSMQKDISQWYRCPAHGGRRGPIPLGTGSSDAGETSGLTSNVPPTCSASLIPCAQTYLVPLDDLYLGGPHAQQWFTALPKLDLMFLHEWDDHNYNYTEQQFAIVGNHRVKKLLPTGNEMAAYYPSLSRHILSKLKSEEKKLQSYREVLPSRKPQKPEEPYCAARAHTRVIEEMKRIQVEYERSLTIGSANCNYYTGAFMSYIVHCNTARNELECIRSERMWTRYATRPRTTVTSSCPTKCRWSWLRYTTCCASLLRSFRVAERNGLHKDEVQQPTSKFFLNWFANSFGKTHTIKVMRRFLKNTRYGDLNISCNTYYNDSYAIACAYVYYRLRHYANGEATTESERMQVIESKVQIARFRARAERDEEVAVEEPGHDNEEQLTTRLAIDEQLVAGTLLRRQKRILATRL